MINVRGVGFEQIDLAEPLVGLIDRKTGQRGLVYQFVQGTPANSNIDRSTELNKPEHYRFVEIAAYLDVIFERNKIRARDLVDRQFLVSPDGRSVHLIDITQYSRINPT